MPISEKDLVLDKLEEEVAALESPEGYLYAGLPKFMGLFGRDALISGWQLLDYNPEIAKNSLLALAELQGKKINRVTGEEPGKIPHEYYSKNVPDNWFQKEKGDISWLQKEVPVYFSVDSTPLFIILTAEYYRKTGDAEFIGAIRDNIKDALNWLLDYGMINGLLVYDKRSQEEEGLISQSWKDGIGETLEAPPGPIAIVELQGYAYRALQDLIKLTDVISLADNPEKNNELKQRLEWSANDLKRRFHQSFYMEDEQFYCLGLDGEGQQIKRITSNPGQLLFTGILDKAQADLVVKRLFRNDMWTPYGIRTHSSLEPDFDPLSYQRGAVWPHDNWIIAQGLLKRGYMDEYQRLKEALLRAYKELGGRMPEYYGVSIDNKITIDNLETPPCNPQAWSVGAMINLLLKQI